MNFFLKNKKRKLPRFNSAESSRGFLAVEVLIVAAIVTASVLASTTVAQKAITVSRQSLHNSQAAFLLEEGAEAVRIYRDNSWDNIASMSPGVNYYLVYSANTWTFSITPSVVDSFTRVVTLSNVNRDAVSGNIVTSGGVLDTGTKLVTVTVSWNTGGGVVSKVLQFYISDIFNS